MKKFVLIISIILNVFFNLLAQKPVDISKMDAFVNSLISQMTLEEKVGQMNQIPGDYAVTGPLNPTSNKREELRKGMFGSMINSVGALATRDLQRVAIEETRLKIPLMFGHDIIHGCKTIFPIPLAESSSWDLKAMEKSARIAAIEASAMGIQWTFAPMVDIARDARWGRIAEGAGEDPYLGSLIAKARVKGFQGNNLSDKTTIVACAKHYAAYGAVIAGRDYNAVDMSEYMLRSVYLPPFKAAVDAGVGTFMNSFNTLNGIPATANNFLLRKILKGEWNFTGFVISDYNSVGELVAHGIAADKAEAATLAANAGCDMDMDSHSYRNELVTMVKQGKVNESVINDAVYRILCMKYKLGLFDDPYRYSDPEREKTDLMKPEFIAEARSSGRKSIVLLKNLNNLLPLSKDTKTLAVIGPLADTQKEMLGSWYGAGDKNDVVTILKGICSAVSKNTKILYSKGCEIDNKNSENFSEAIQVAQKADVVIMVLGEAGEMSGEAHSRTDIGLPGNQLDMVKAIKKTGKPIVVLLSSGRPLAIPWLAENVPAILETWFLGTQAGHAIADVIFGDYNPSGKLTVSFPYNVGQEPLYYAQLNTGRPKLNDANDIYRTNYNDAPNDALYPFGYGLSYTTFSYENLALNKTNLSKGDTLKVQVKISNTGKVYGEEIVQLYIRDLVASVSRPVKELRGFEKIMLQSGESKTVIFNLTEEDLKFYDKNMQWVAEPGDFEVFIGTNSRDVQKVSFILN